MKSLYRLLLLTLGFFLVIFVYCSYQPKYSAKIATISNHGSKILMELFKNTSSRPQRPSGEIIICVVACGTDRFDESLTMIKSALVFSKKPLRFIVISETGLIPAFIEKLTGWKESLNKSFDFIVKPISFPNIGNVGMWRKLFKPCAAQRLFLPSVLNDTDSVLYVDTDTLFLGPPEQVWEKFKEMNSSQLAALSPEHEDPNVGWYNRFARHPYYGKLGVNSGVMLMNLTRMRKFKWIDYVIPIHKQYRLKITWGDQDIINILFHDHPERLLVYSCRYNYRPDHCMYMSVCSEAEKYGALVLHGSRGIFHSNKQPPFKAVYSAMQEYQLSMNPYENLLIPMKNYLSLEDRSNCGQVLQAFLIQPQLSLGNL